MIDFSRRARAVALGAIVSWMVTPHPAFEASLDDDQAELKVTEVKVGKAFSVEVSPLGGIAAITYEAGIRVIDVETGETRRDFAYGKHQLAGASFSSGGEYIAAVTWDGALVIWRVADGVLLKAIRSKSEVYRCVRFSPQGTELLVQAAQRITDSVGDIRVLDLSTVLESVEDVTGRETGIRMSRFGRFDLSEDGRRLVTLNENVGLTVYDLKERKLECSQRPYHDEVHGPVISKNGALVAESVEGEVAVSRAGDCKRIWRGGKQAGIKALAFSPTGELLATGGYGESAWSFWYVWLNHGLPPSTPGTIRIWDVRSGALRLAIRAGDLEVNDVAFSPDGRKILGALSDGHVRAWSVENGELIWTGPLDKRIRLPG